MSERHMEGKGIFRYLEDRMMIHGGPLRSASWSSTAKETDPGNTVVANPDTPSPNPVSEGKWLKEAKEPANRQAIIKRRLIAKGIRKS